ADPDDRLDALEAVLPRHHQLDRRAVLVGHDTAVETDGQDRERMQRLAQAQLFDVRPLQRAGLLARHLVGRELGRERDVLRARRGLELLDQRAEREAGPGDYHRPGLDAAQAIDALFEREA